MTTYRGMIRRVLTPGQIREILADNISSWFQILAHDEPGTEHYSVLCWQCAKEIAGEPGREFLSFEEDELAVFGHGNDLPDYWEFRQSCLCCKARILYCDRDAPLAEILHELWEKQLVELDGFRFNWREKGFLPALRSLLWIETPFDECKFLPHPTRRGELIRRA